MDPCIFPQHPDCIFFFFLKLIFFASHERTVYLYKPLPMSWLTGFFGYLIGNVAEYSNPERTIGSGEGREGI